MGDGICSVDRCKDAAMCRGLCSAHYQRLKRHGDPLAGGPRRTGNPAERFASFTDRNGPNCERLGSRCWQWTGNKTKQGYGLFYAGGQAKKVTCAHRWAYERFVAPIATDGTVDHLCRNVACVNPAHFEIVSLAENIRRAGPNGVSKIAAAKTHCPKGHAYSEHGVWYPNGYSKTGRPKRARRCTACQPHYGRMPHAERIG